ncbi:MAG TPA: hypothetical protein VLR52_05785, partial [Bacteroidales bacterium]|nr:hypothetical protein [Bacteroidales bacterium]
MKKLILLLLLCPFFLHSMAQNDLKIFGQITNIANGNPVVNQQVIILLDSNNTPGYPNFYYNQVYTDNYGYYRDTIYFSTGIPNGVLWIYTYDCNMV